MEIDQNIVAGLTDKKQKYELLVTQVSSLIEGESNMIANLANVTALLHHGLQFFWTGFYLPQGEELILGPFQGPVACTRIRYGRGVCGTAWKNSKTIIVDDVDKFPDHIACSQESRSEIVVPAFVKKDLIFVLDIDSDKLNNFDEIDKEYLQHITGLLLNQLSKK